MRQRTLAILSILAMLFLFLASCKSTTTTTSTTTSPAATTTKPATSTTTAIATTTKPATTTAAVVPAGTLTIAYPASIPAAAFNPSVGLSAQYLLHYVALYDAVFKPAVGAPAVNPSLATGYTVSTDGLTYDIKIRQGVKFTNGDDLTAADVKFSFDRYTGVGASIFKQHGVTATVPDAYTLRFTLNAPWNDFLTWYATGASNAAWVLPQKYWTSLGSDDKARDDTFLSKPIGSGPYKFVSVTPEALTLEANATYWAKTPYIKTVIIKSISDDSARLAALQTGAVDLTYRLIGPTLDAALKDSKITVVPSNADGPVVLNFLDQWDSASPWANQDIRKAAALAIDKQGIMAAFYGGKGTVNGNAIPLLQYTKNLPAVPYDKVQAAALLKAAGYTPANPLKVTLNVQNLYSQQAQAIAGNWAEVGIQATLNVMEVTPASTAYSNKTMKGVFLYPQTGSGNAAMVMTTFLMPRPTTGAGAYSYQPVGAIPQVDTLWAQQANELDITKRGDQLGQIQQIEYDQYRYVRVFTNVSLLGVGPTVANPTQINLRPDSLGFFVGPYEDLQLKAK